MVQYKLLQLWQWLLSPSSQVSCAAVLLKDFFKLYLEIVVLLEFHKAELAHLPTIIKVKHNTFLRFHGATAAS